MPDAQPNSFQQLPPYWSKAWWHNFPSCKITEKWPSFCEKGWDGCDDSAIVQIQRPRMGEGAGGGGGGGDYSWGGFIPYR